MRTQTLGQFALNVADLAVFLSQMSFFVMLFAAFMTHIIHCIMMGKPLLLIVGVLISPVAIIHGMGLWFI